MVKNIQNRPIKKIQSILALKKSGRYTIDQLEWSIWSDRLF